MVSVQSATAERAFRARVAELGGTVLEPVWLGKDKPHRCLCAVGHVCAPMPGNVRRGQGICRTCATKDPSVAEAAFRSRVAELGGIVLEPVWLGKGKPHRVRCAAGHECSPHPTSVQQGRGICLACSGRDPITAEAAFRSRVAELGGIVLEPVYLGTRKPHRVRCAAGHECFPTPNHIQQGDGICRICAGKSWDAFYVVTNQEAFRLKLGITSGDPRARLGVHKRTGYRSVVRLMMNLPGTIARDMERHTLSALRLAGEIPIRGREYFGAHVLGTVLDIVDNYPISER